MTNSVKNKKKPFIIVADDDKFLATVLKTNLVEAQYEVMMVENGEEAIQALQVRPPDILVLDLIMPVKDGFEVLREMSADGRLKGTKVIVLTNLSQEEDKKRVLATGGVTEYVVKADASINDVVKRIKLHLA